MEEHNSTEESDNLREVLVKALRVAYESRSRLSSLAAQDSVSMSPADLHERLLSSRKVVDVLENELVTAVLAKSRVDRLKARIESEVEDAEIASADPATTRQDYMSARDRSIDINSRTLSQRRRLRKVTDLAIEAQATVRALQELHRGADAYRRETDTRIRAVTLVSSMER